MATIDRSMVDIKQGYLTKSPDLDKHRGIKASFMAWKKRWFVFRNVQENPTLSYYQDQKTFQKEKKRPHGIIELAHCEAIESKPEVEVLKHRYENVICITVSSSPKKPHDKRLYYLMADSREDMLDWYKKLQEVLVALNLMEPVEGDGLIRSNTVSHMNKLPKDISSRRNYHSAPTGTLEDQFKRRSSASTDSSNSYASNQSDSSRQDGAAAEQCPENVIVDAEVEERVCCCRKRHVIFYDQYGTNMADKDVIYENIHFIRNQCHWEKDAMQRKERIVEGETEYQDFSAIKTLQNENTHPETDTNANKIKPPPPPRGDSLPDQEESCASTQLKQSEGGQLKPRRRKISVQMQGVLNLTPEKISELAKEGGEEQQTSPQRRERRKGNVSSPVGLQQPNVYSAGPSVDQSRLSSGSFSSYQLSPSESFDEPPPYDIPPTPWEAQNSAGRPLSGRGMQAQGPGEGFTPSCSNIQAPRQRPVMTRKMSHQELANRPLPTPGQDNQPQPRRKISVGMLNRPLPTVPDGTATRDSAVRSSVEGNAYSIYPQEDMPDRPPPPPPATGRKPRKVSMSSMGQSTQQAILLSPCVNNNPQKLTKRSRSGSLPDLLDDDDFQTFSRLHPEVQARVPPQPSTLQREMNLYSQNPNDCKPKIPESRSSKKETKASFDTLESEMRQTDGITRTIVKEYLDGKSVALVGINNSVWVAGWKSDIPNLQNVFHIGDQILAIDDRSVGSVSEAYDAMARSEGPVVKVQFRRLPLGKMFTMNRQGTNEDWGMVIRSVGTGLSVHSEIDQVVIGGLAYNSGLKPKCRSVFNRLSSWAITELNFETIPLFTSTSKVRKQLQDAGVSLVILVQPCDFVKELKKQLQETRNWLPEILQAPQFVVPDE